MKQLLFIASMFLLCNYQLQAQSTNNRFEKDFDAADKILSNVFQINTVDKLTYSRGDYAQARPLFLELYQQDTTNMNIAFKLGICYLNSRRERIKAIYYLNKSVSAVSADYKERSHKERNAPLVAYKFLGDAYHLNYQFDNAIQAYLKFIALTTDDRDTKNNLIVEAKRRIEMCYVAKKLIASPVNITIENLGKDVNSAYADYTPVISADQSTLFFTSRRPDSTGEETDFEGNYMEDIYMSTKTEKGWSEAVNIGLPVNTGEHEATTSISPDGQTIIVYKDDLGDGNIYYTTLNGDEWSKPVKLNENINSTSWEPSACIYADGNILYFSSNRPGGIGERDLYTSKRLPKGDWAVAVNMGPTINTIYEEDAPFIHPDGVTLVFSSNGHKTMGGFDIFTSTLSQKGTWSEPENVGTPINTTDDDIYYVLSPDGRKAYFTSFREDGVGEKDNYVATFLERKETPLTLLKGVVTDEFGNPVADVEITVTDNETEEIVGIYSSNRKTGQYLFILTPGRNYNITYQAENRLFYSENMEIPMETNYYEIKKAIILPPLIVGSKITLKNIFFDFDKSTLRPLSNVEIKNLVSIMNKYPSMKVEISGHTDSKGNDGYNEKLSESRAQAVLNRLKASGIKANRMTAKGYGEKQPVANNENADGTDNPEGRQLNRRVEFKITAID